MRSSTGMGSAPGPALKFKTRFVLRSDNVVGFTVRKSSVQNIGFRGRPKRRSRTTRITEVRREKRAHVSDCRGMNSLSAGIIVIEQAAPGGALETRRTRHEDAAKRSATRTAVLCSYDRTAWNGPAGDTCSRHPCR